MNNKDIDTIAIIGMGYVGLPLAIAFGAKRRVVCFDISKKRIDELKQGIDITLEVSKEELKEAQNLFFSSHVEDIKDINCYIITVPTPVDLNKQPDLENLISASKIVGSVLSKNNIVIYESTVYPGVTEEVCVPLLERLSSLKFNLDFFCGYSPERINPGDKEHRITNIKKVTSGSTPKIASLVDSIYNEIIEAGTHKAESIKIAEAAKVIENTQRDINIALINELAIIFNKIGIDTEAVIKAASSKWNFLPFKPGLVGGHCIGVDPYYLTYKAQSLGYNPEIILAGRRINDGMSSYVVAQLIKQLLKKHIKLELARILIMGITFKENCPDLRNSKVIDLVKELKDFNFDVDIMDPYIKKNDLNEELKAHLIREPNPESYDGIIIAVAHEEFRNIGIEYIRKLGKKNHILYDLKYVFKANETDLRL